MLSNVSADPIVYVIDDDDSARHSLEFLLDVAGIRVRSFPSADVFLKASPPLANSCVITDVRMPGMSGVELVEALRARGVGAPVIIITGHADVPLAIRAMKAGAADFIEKPFDEHAILSAIRRALADSAEDEEFARERHEINERLALLEQLEDWLETPMLVLGLLWLALLVVDLVWGLSPLLEGAASCGSEAAAAGALLAAFLRGLRFCWPRTRSS